MSLADRLQAMRPMEIGVPGPTPRDMARNFRRVRSDPLSFLAEVAGTYGDLVHFPVPGAPALLVNDPADVRHVLQGAARNWGKQTVQYAALARVTGPGLLASAESSWIDHRRVAAPAFLPARLEAVGDRVRAAAADAVDGLLPTLAREGSVVDVAPLMQHTSLDAVGRALFSADLSPRARQLVTASGRSADLVVRLGRSLLPTTAWVPTPLNVRLRRTRTRLDAAAADLVAERRRQTAASPDGSGADLLGLLLDSGLSDREIRDELVTMVIAGHETVAASLTWTLMLLAEHPEAQDRLREEVAGRAGSLPMLGQREQLPWTRAVVDEGLRLYPPAWAISRRALGDDELDGRTVPAGTLAIISPWLLHRSAASWPDPRAFRPERFLGPGTTRHPAYLPFGLGPRLCIGRELALSETVLVLARLLQHVRIEVPSGWTRPAARALVAVHPEGGMPLRLVPRTGTS